MKSFRNFIKKGLPVIVLIMAAALILSRVISPDRETAQEVPEAEIRIHTSEALSHIGTATEVCGPLAQLSHATNLRGEPTFLNFGRAHPNQEFTAVIWESSVPNWLNSGLTHPKLKYAADESIYCVTGKIEEHRGGAQIEVFSPEQIQRMR
ncbi:MAG: hypothetical protein LAT67_11600 [Balneolales bacterium]|nr:hypothetical protein [Balneolales bacterium]